MTKADPLAALRRDIDEVDGALVTLLARRMRIVDQVIAIKQINALPATVPERIDAVVDHVRCLAAKQNVPERLVEQLWRSLIAETIAYEETMLGAAPAA
jgi:isochorismate pyruvate lyase